MIKKKRENLGNPRRILLAIFGIVLMLATFKIVLANGLAVAGEKTNSIENQISQTNQENDELKGEVSRLSSLYRISSDAKNLGFVESGSVASLTFEMPIALR